MKNIFDVDSNEIKRILSLHEESTKKQYLNVISEDNGEGSYASFDPTQYDYSKVFQKSKVTTKQLNEPRSFSLNLNCNLESVSKTGWELRLFKSAVFNISKENLLYSKTQLQKFSTWSGNESGKAYSGIVWYNCKSGKFSVKGSENEEKYYLPPGYDTFKTNLLSLCKTSKTNNLKDPKIENGKKSLNSQEKQARAEKCGYANWQKYKEGQWTCPKTNKIDSSQVTTFTPQQMVDTTKEVQTLMGIQNPTGQLTDTDIDLIITNLSK